VFISWQKARWFIVLGLLFLPLFGKAADTPVAQAIALNDYETLAPELKVLISLSALSFIPIAVISLTAFTRIVVVLSMLRHAFGMQQTPPNSVILALTLFLTVFTMYPVGSEIMEQTYPRYSSGELTLLQAGEEGLKPIRQFMFKQTKESDLLTILKIAKQPRPGSADDVKTVHLIPAFMLSELKTAFEIAFVIFLPFLLVDIVVASILMSLGMIMLPPTTIALPIKILLFVLVDGWGLVTRSLLASFY
jgi:flagellar biosynthetic protein FliP